MKLDRHYAEDRAEAAIIGKKIDSLGCDFAVGELRSVFEIAVKPGLHQVVLFQVSHVDPQGIPWNQPRQLVTFNVAGIRGRELLQQFALECSIKKSGHSPISFASSRGKPHRTARRVPT